ncbi:MAG TPA: hypothetical protein ENN33_16425, partial [Ignavibacteria bacterium]|nr:hypothetical protein [Ignavibacteria bacterium]
MTHRIIKYFLFFLFAFSLNAQIVKSIEITGNKNFSSSQYLNWIKINNGSPIFEGIVDSINTRITINLHNNGFFFSVIEIEEKVIED